MKEIILLSVFSFITCFLLQGQVMHSPNNFEVSIGVEGFNSFEPRASGIFPERVFGQEPIVGDFKWRSLLSINYKKLKESGNYFGFTGSFGGSAWVEDDVSTSFSDIFGEINIITFSEQRVERTIAVGYLYSFLITKESPNFQFFVGTEGSMYDNFARNIPLDIDGGGEIGRNIFGIRIAAVPELMYLFPNSRLTASFRAKLPIAHFERNSQEARVSLFNSFIGGFSVHNSIDFMALNRTRFELGIGYFLKAK